jgi:hypothetical protein
VNDTSRTSLEHSRWRPGATNQSPNFLPASESPVCAQLTHLSRCGVLKPPAAAALAARVCVRVAPPRHASPWSADDAPV